MLHSKSDAADKKSHPKERPTKREGKLVNTEKL